MSEVLRKPKPEDYCPNGSAPYGKNFMTDRLDYERARADIYRDALKAIQHGDDTAPETMRRAAREALAKVEE